MEALGQKLKETRIGRGIELVEVQEQTKIRARYLEAIEQGKWELLPGQVYAKGFIRSYAEYLGLDGQALLDEYGLAAQSEVKAADPTDHIVMQSRSSKAATERKKNEHSVERKMWPQFAIGAGILAVLIVCYVYVSSRAASSHPDTASNSQQHTNQTAATDTNQLQAKTQKTPQTPTTPPPKPAVVVKPLQNSNNSTSFSVSNTDTISVHMTTPNGNCWVSVTADGKVIYSGTLTQGASQNWSANKKLEILAGYSAAVALEVNGQNVTTVNVQGPYTYSFQMQ